MRDGFIKVAVGTPEIAVADCAKNAESVICLMREAYDSGAKLLTLPELCLTGYTAADLLLHGVLREGAIRALDSIILNSARLDMLTVVGLPLSIEGRLYNCAAVVKDGELLGIVPKRNLPNYGEFYELRHFTPGEAQVHMVSVLGAQVPFGGDLLFECSDLEEFKVAVEICEDLWVPDSPGVRHARAGATVIVNLSASDETVGKADYREMLVSSQSGRLVCAYLYANAGAGESSTDLVFAGGNFIAENGQILARSQRYTCGVTVADIDVQFLASERLRMNTFGVQPQGYTRIPFSFHIAQTPLNRPIDPMPFVPSDDLQRAKRCEEILGIQAAALVQRLKHLNYPRMVIGVSGGLDSTLALLVAARALAISDQPSSRLLAITMPGFGTTGRTYGNSVALTRELGAEFREISIKKSVECHFNDIGQDIAVHDVIYENSQARERTQILMDVANQCGGIVVGTGDLSELALGWATYNGDHMSMYGVNASIPKTLIRYIVRYTADQTENQALRDILYDILDTPVSPELLPPVEGKISQRTEELVGPYELHDFFLYHMLRRMSSPAKILRLAQLAFKGKYDEQIIRDWLKVFCRRFFNQQFKRSCMPDGPKVGAVALSPRGDLRMPSDASAALWNDSFFKSI